MELSTKEIETISSSSAIHEVICAPLSLPAPKRSFWDKVGPIFFNTTLKLCALRLTILASFLNSCLGALWVTVLFADRDAIFEVASAPISKKAIVCLVVMVFTFLHQVVSAFKFAFFLRVIDLPLIVAEIILLGIYSEFFVFDRWSPQLIIAVVISIWTLVGCLIFLTLCRLAAVIRRIRGDSHYLFEPFDLLEDSEGLKKGLPTKRSPVGVSILVGQSIWKQHFYGESDPVRLTRGLLSGFFVIVMIVYGMITLAVYPVRETALTPVKEYRVMGLPDDFKSDDIGWNILVDVPYSVGIDAINVKSLWVDSSDNNPSCTGSSQGISGNLNITMYHCPGSEDLESGEDVSWAEHIFPNILIQVNYTALGIEYYLDPRSQADIFQNGLKVWPGLTINIDNIGRTSPALIMTPGSNYLAALDVEFRQVFSRPALSGLGLFGATRTFAAAQLFSLVSDPILNLRSNPFGISTGEDIATLRLYVREPLGELRITQDYREKAALDGFAVIGGLWTFLSAVFVVLFGVSLSRILFDVKPLSIFGFVQQFERDKIAKDTLSHYKMLRSDLLPSDRDGGLLTLLGDHLIDLELLRTHLNETSKQEK